MGETNAFSVRLGSGLGRLDGGLNVCDPPVRLDPSQAQSAENVWYDRSALRRRPGFADAGAFGTGAAVDTLYDDGSGRILLQSGSHLYAWDADTGTLTDLCALTIPAGDAAAPKGSFLPGSDGQMYFINGCQYLRWDGQTVRDVLPTAPKYRIYSDTELTVVPLEKNAPNLLTPRVTIEYRISRTDAVTRLVLPPEVRTDILPESVSVNGTAITGYSLNGDHLELNTSCSGMGSTFQVVTELRAQHWPGDMGIRNCTCAADYGSEGRVFLCGGSNRVYVSAPFDPACFPADCVQGWGPGEPLTGFGKLYGTLIVFRAHGMASVDLTGGGIRMQTVHPSVGCDMPGTICTVGNRLVWANSYAGVHMLVSTARETERNVQNISRNIDPLLLAENAADLAAAQAVEYGGRWWLRTGPDTWVWDCTGRPYTAAGGAEKCAWYRFTGIPAAHFFVRRGSLYFNADGSDALRRFEARGDDLGEPFPAHWRSGALDGGLPERCKHLDRLQLTLLRDEPSRFTVTVRCDEREENETLLWPETVECAASETGQTAAAVIPVRRRGLTTFSLAFDCPDAEAGMAIADVRADCRKGPRIARF